MKKIKISKIKIYYQCYNSQNKRSINSFQILSHASESHDQHDSPFMGDGIVRELSPPSSQVPGDQRCIPRLFRIGKGTAIHSLSRPNREVIPFIIMCKYIQAILALHSSNLHILVIIVQLKTLLPDILAHISSIAVQ